MIFDLSTWSRSFTNGVDIVTAHKHQRKAANRTISERGPSRVR
jgi:hypothetical protein